MLLKDMIVKVEQDLHVANHRARGYVAMFSELYPGRKEAISEITASYTNDGRVKITYTINGKKNHIVLGNESPYAREVSTRRNKNQ